ncbi:MAG: FAD binding domain-containing protein [Dehalococcoidaceae bacterium]|nr:FAD binding domain-containing protein [Dehalococcoidaceae bacterium]
MNQFNHVNASTVAEAASLKAGGNAALMAGGTDLLTTLIDYINPTQPATVVNLKNIPNLDYIKEESGMLKIGALARLTDIADSSVVKDKWAALAEAAGKVATPQIRNMGTIAGNLCQESRCWYYRSANNYFHCLRKGGVICQAVPGNNTYHAILGGSGCFSPFPSDTAIALTALGATVVTNKRSIGIEDFYEVLGNTLGNDELVTEIQVAAPASGTKQVYSRYALRKSFDFPVSCVAIVATMSGSNVSDCKIVLGGCVTRPWRVTGAEDALKGKAVNEANAEAVGTEAVKGALALPYNKWLIQLTKTLVKRAVLSLA